MIEEIRLRNFQGHRDTTLKLSPGVNVISGPSNVGKSSIIRAIWWLCRNRPAGAADKYRHCDAPKGEPVSVQFLVGDTYIARFKEGSRSGYAIGDRNNPGNQDELVAVRTDVPDEIASVLAMADHNLQLQHPPHNYFLVADSPADVAAKLNAVAGLDVIDATLRNGATLAGRTNQDIAVCEARIKELTADLERFSDLDARAERVAGLEKLDGKIQQMDDDIEFMEDTTAQLRKVRDDLAGLDEFLEIEARATPLFDLATDLARTDDDIDYLQSAIDTGRRLRMEREALDAKIVELEREFHKTLKDGGVCPLCEQEVA